MLKKVCLYSVINVILYFIIAFIFVIIFNTLDIGVLEIFDILDDVLDLEEIVLYFIIYIFSLSITYCLSKAKKSKLRYFMYIFINFILFTIVSDVFENFFIIRNSNEISFIVVTILNLLFVFKEISSSLDKILGEGKNNNFSKIIIFLLFIIAVSLLKIAF